MISRALRRLYFSSIKYTKNHEWIHFNEGTNKYYVGITQHAQEQLGEIVHVEFPSIGSKYEAGDPVITIESVKATAEVYSPQAGEIVELNTLLTESPTLINEKPHDTWIFQILCEEPPSDWLNKEEYEEFVKEEDH